MAKTSMIQKNKRRAKRSLQATAKRARLKEIVMSKTISAEERFAAQLKLAAMPRNANKTRVRNRCEITGRPRAVYRRFKLSRIALRDLASLGMIPGVTQSSW